VPGTNGDTEPGTRLLLWALAQRLQKRQAPMATLSPKVPGTNGDVEPETLSPKVPGTNGDTWPGTQLLLWALATPGLGLSSCSGLWRRCLQKCQAPMATLSPKVPGTNGARHQWRRRAWDSALALELPLFCLFLVVLLINRLFFRKKK